MATPDVDDELQRLRRAAAGCQACALWSRATQTVFGEGPAPTWLMLIGEQPGDQEDVAGRPFVGPAGRVLDEALAAAGVRRATIYTTNAVKHSAPGGRSGVSLTPDDRRPGLTDLPVGANYLLVTATCW